MKNALALLATLISCAALAQPAPSVGNGLRGPTPLDKEGVAPLMSKMVNDDVRKGRAYVMQPPVIPHQIDNYQVDKNFNRCMACHGRERVAESQAPMVSVTHFMDRNNQSRAEISPRRYFCTLCHVPQTEVKPPVDNTFIDAGKVGTSLLKPTAGNGK